MVFERRFRFIDAADFGPARPFPQQTREFRKLRGIPRGVDLNVAIIQVAHPPSQPQPARGMLDKIAKPHALHSPTHAIEPR